MAIWTAGGCSRTVRSDDTSGDATTEVIPKNASALPAGANVTVQLDQDIGLRSSVGERFTMHLTQPVVALDRAIVIPLDAMIFGHVTAVEASRSAASPGSARLDFDSLRVGSRLHPFSAVVLRVAARDTTEDVFRPPPPGAPTVPWLGRVLPDSVPGQAAGTRISLGAGAAGRLPAGTKMTLRSTRRVPL